MKLPRILFAAALAAALIPNVFADQQFSVSEDGYVVHYSAFPSVFLDPDMAQRYNIDRADDRAVVNISVRKGKPGETGSAATAKVTGKVSDLIHSRELNFREIREKDAVYYIAEFWHGPKANVRFDVKVTPEGRDTPITATFSEDFARGQ